MDIPLPYDLTEDRIVLDPASTGKLMDDEMDWLNDHIPWNDEEVMERIFRSTVLLFHRHNSKVPLGECLSTALIWEVG